MKSNLWFKICLKFVNKLFRVVINDQILFSYLTYLVELGLDLFEVCGMVF
jgi:hypothetical protein